MTLKTKVIIGAVAVAILVVLAMVFFRGKEDRVSDSPLLQ